METSRVISCVTKWRAACLADRKCGEASPHTSLALSMRKVRFVGHNVQEMAECWHASAFQRGDHNFGAKNEHFDTPHSM